MRKATFNYLENELYCHEENKWLLTTNELTDRQVERLKEQVQAVDRLYLRAESNMRRFIELKYFNTLSWSKVSQELNINRFSLFEFRRLFIKKLADTIGLI